MELRDYLDKIQDLDVIAMKDAEKRWLSIVKPLFSLGEFENIVTRIAGI